MPVHQRKVHIDQGQEMIRDCSNLGKGQIDTGCQNNQALGFFKTNCQDQAKEMNIIRGMPVHQRKVHLDQGQEIIKEKCSIKRKG